MHDGDMSNFNSIKVRLELKLLLKTDCLNIFQFHKGTIRTFFPAYKDTLSYRFQFHKGTIRT